MPRTAQEYQQRWHDAMTPGCTQAPWDERFSPTSCVIYETARATPAGNGCTYLPDFGDAICFYRYLRIPEELDSAPAEGIDVAGLLPDLALQGWSWSRYRSRFSPEEIQRRRSVGEQALDKLLTRYVHEGYRAEMGERLMEIVNATLIDFTLGAVYVLPDDLGALLSRFGNPLADCAGTGDAGCAQSIAFDLNAPGHREALADYLVASAR